MKKNPLIKKYGNRKQWVTWKYKMMGGGTQTTVWQPQELEKLTESEEAEVELFGKF